MYSFTSFLIVLKHVVKFLLTSLSSDRKYLKKLFHKYHGYKLDLDNPKTLNEKIQWLKLNNHSDICELISDKENVKNYISRKLKSSDFCPRTYLLWDTWRDIDLSEIKKDNYVIKTTHGCGDAIIVDDKTDLKQDCIKKHFQLRFLNNLYFQGREKQYRKLERRILVEELLLDEAGKPADDLKVHCFNGKPEFLYVVNDRYGVNTRSLATVEWENIPAAWTKKRPEQFVPIDPLSRPDYLEQLLQVAEILSKDFIYIRVDFYLLKDHFKIGELTLHQGSGFDRFYPSDYDLIFGDRLILH